MMLKLDPKPWMTREVWSGKLQIFRTTRKIDATDIFRPRPEYSQNREDYE